MSNILAVYLYGSHVYGTADDQSDTDYIFVVDQQKEKEKQVFAGNHNITAYPHDYFQSLLESHIVSILECYFLPQRYKIELFEPSKLSLDIGKLRKSFSEKASNSWVKAKKKIDLHGEYRLGRKSLFHALRILNFGIQIAEEGKIVDYRRASHLMDLIKKQEFTEWQKYKEFWQPKYNELKSKFKSVAPMGGLHG